VWPLYLKREHYAPTLDRELAEMGPYWTSDACWEAEAQAALDIVHHSCERMLEAVNAAGVCLRTMSEAVEDTDCRNTANAALGLLNRELAHRTCTSAVRDKRRHFEAKNIVAHGPGYMLRLVGRSCSVDARYGPSRYRDV
jgi:hypothetical protein